MVKGALNNTDKITIGFNSHYILKYLVTPRGSHITTADEMLYVRQPLLRFRKRKSNTIHTVNNCNYRATCDKTPLINVMAEKLYIYLKI